MHSLAQALAFAEAQRRRPTQDWTNLCQSFSRQCVGAAPWATSARLAYNAIPVEHKHAGTPPTGALVYFGAVDAGFGHATFSDGGGNVYSTDILRRGKVDIVPLTLIPAKWGLRYRGWIDWTPSGAIATAVPVPPWPAWVNGQTWIGWGSSGAQVAAVQRALVGAGYHLAITEEYDPATRAALGPDADGHGYLPGHDYAWKRDGAKPGVVGPNVYASLASYYPRA